MNTELKYPNLRMLKPVRLNKASISPSVDRFSLVNSVVAPYLIIGVLLFRFIFKAIHVYIVLGKQYLTNIRSTNFVIMSA